MDNQTNKEVINMVLSDKTAQVVEECNLSQDIKYAQKLFNEKLSKLEKEMNRLMPELKIKEIPLLNNIVLSSFELGVVNALHHQKFNSTKKSELNKLNVPLEKEIELPILSKINDQNPLAG
jgi:hypothetical protein